MSHVALSLHLLSYLVSPLSCSLNSTRTWCSMLWIHTASSSSTNTNRHHIIIVVTSKHWCKSGCNCWGEGQVWTGPRKLGCGWVMGEVSLITGRVWRCDWSPSTEFFFDSWHLFFPLYLRRSQDGPMELHWNCTQWVNPHIRLVSSGYSKFITYLMCLAIQKFHIKYSWFVYYENCLPRCLLKKNLGEIKWVTGLLIYLDTCLQDFKSNVVYIMFREIFRHTIDESGVSLKSDPTTSR